MDAPVGALPRIPSSSSFAPGRRSHPNLQHLSLAPLTPRYPIDPADYSPYFDPSTSELHTSSSISHISGLPSPGGILTNSPVRSRANSRTRLRRKTRSHVSINLPEGQHHGTAPSGALTSQGFDHSSFKRTASSRSHLHLGDSDWLVQTGLSLTASSRETKGQSWIAQRDSSTSLVSLHTAYEERQSRSGRTTPFASRPGSRVTSRVGSRATSRSRRSKRDLAMTSAAVSSLQLSKALSVEEVQPDWQDKESQAEIAAQLARDMADEWDDDPYGALNFEDQIDIEMDTEDEEEVRRELRKAGWFDGVVDVFLKLEEDYPESELEKGMAGPSASDTTTATPKPAKKPPKPELLGDDEVEIPPEQPGLWNDVKWFGRVIARTVRS